MTVESMNAGLRVDPPLAADERTMLTSWLDWHRATVRAKCLGLDAAGAAEAPLATSPLLTIGGVVSHLRWVEHIWFEALLLGTPDRGPYSNKDPDGEFRVGAQRPLSQLLTEYDQQCARSQEVTAKLDLGSTARRSRLNEPPVTLRWILVHMIEETARHNGHLDILRELHDGEVGD